MCQCPEPYGGLTCADGMCINILPMDCTYSLHVIHVLVICNSYFCVNGGTCEVSPVGLTCRCVDI